MFFSLFFQIFFHDLLPFSKFIKVHFFLYLQDMIFFLSFKSNFFFRTNLYLTLKAVSGVMDFLLLCWLLSGHNVGIKVGKFQWKLYFNHRSFKDVCKDPGNTFHPIPVYSTIVPGIAYGSYLRLNPDCFLREVYIVCSIISMMNTLPSGLKNI